MNRFRFLSFVLATTVLQVLGDLVVRRENRRRGGAKRVASPLPAIPTALGISQRRVDYFGQRAYPHTVSPAE
jgi:hypothetical protein